MRPPVVKCSPFIIECHTDFLNRVIYISANVHEDAVFKMLGKHNLKGKIAWINNYFPCASKEDERHMTTKLANLVVNSVDPYAQSPSMTWTVEKRRKQVAADMDHAPPDFRH